MTLFIRKFSKNHIIVFSVIVTILTLMISSFFNWDQSPITGIDKIVGDLIITIFCVALIYILGIVNTAGFCKVGFLKGLIYGIPFIMIGICAAFIGNVGLNISQLKPVHFSAMLMFTVNMLLVGVNEEISMRSLLLNNLICKLEKVKMECLRLFCFHQLYLAQYTL